MIEIGEFALGVVYSLITDAIQKCVKLDSLDFFQKRKISRRIEDAVANVVEPLMPFLRQEGIKPQQQELLIQTCIDELKPLIDEPTLLLLASLDGQKLFEQIYLNKNLPQSIRDEGLADIYSLLFPRIGSVLCRILGTIVDWENQAWAENYKRLDLIVVELRLLFEKVDALSTKAETRSEQLFSTVKRSIAQKVCIEMDLTGLRADKPITGKLEDLFVHPALSTTIHNQRFSIGTPDESIRELFYSNKCSVVIGGAGSGKSTLTKWFHRKIVMDSPEKIAVRLELRSFSGKAIPSFHELVRDASGKHLAEEINSNDITLWKSEGRIVLLIDGFDELTPTDRDSAKSWLIELETATRPCPIILTSRPLTTDHIDNLGSSWLRWNVEEFDLERVIEYIKKWYLHTPLSLDGDSKPNAEDLAEMWSQDPTIGPLTGNPLLLSTLLMVHHLDGSLPSGRSNLYKRYVDGMLGLWDDRRKVNATSIQLSKEQKREVLRKLALYLHLNEKEQIYESEMNIIMTEFLTEMRILLNTEDVLSCLRERSGLLIGPGQYSFIHKSVAEYLVAEVVLDGVNSNEEGHRIDRLHMFENRFNDRWNTVIFLWAGLAPVKEVESFIDNCMSSKAPPLAYGLLYDQYDRISIETRIKMLTKLIINEENVLSEFYTRKLFMSSCGSTMGELTLDLFMLRTIIHASLHDLISKAFKKQDLKWNINLQKCGSIRNSVWAACIFNTRDFTEWIECFLSLPPSEGKADSWRLWAIQYLLLFKYCSGYNYVNFDFSILKDICIKAFPNLIGSLPLLLMSNICSIIKYYNKKQINYSTLHESLKLLSSFPITLIADEWFYASLHWCIAFGDESKDLLESFENTIEILKRNNVNIEEDVYNSALLYVSRLRNYRKAKEL